MARPRAEIRLEIEDLLEMSKWGAEEESEFNTLMEEYPEENEADEEFLVWAEEAAFLLLPN